MKQAKKQQCDEAECAVENALERMRRAGRKNELAARAHQRGYRSARDEETLELTDSGLHLI